MPSETTHHVAGPLTVAVGLAATAGFVDAFVFQHVMPVFVANMSGNLIHLGMALGNVQWQAVAMAALALVAFSAAVLAGSALLDHHVVSGGSPDPAPLLLAEAALLTVVAVVAVATDVELSAELTGPHIAIVVLGAAAMGAQAVSVRRVGEIAVSTTYGTGSLVRVGEKVALALRRASRHHDVPRRHSVAVLTSVLVAYIAGAVVASALPGRPGLLAIVPVVTLLLARQAHVLRESANP